MLNPAENELLTLTGPGTAMGTLFRRFWMPVALSDEIAEPDSPPCRVQILGEYLLLFRQTDGQISLIEPKCAHRGADLYWGRNEECGLRCVYHGWKYNAQGQCVDIPNMRPSAARENMIRSVRLKTWPVLEAGGLIWAYLGPEALQPPLPVLEFCTVPAGARYVSKKLQECNWAQSLEGALDTAHFSFAHQVLPGAANAREVYDDDRAKWIRDDGAPDYEVLDHPAGLSLGGARLAGPGLRYWRISQFLLPNHSLAPAAMTGETFTGQTWVPVDDENCWIYTYAWNPDRDLNDEELERYQAGRSVHAIVDENYVPLRNRSNEYKVDRQLQKTSSFTGVSGLSEQDACIQDSQGRIADRAREALVPSDAGVIRFRKLMLDQARGLAEGQEPPAARQPDAYCLRSGGIVTTEGKPLDEVMTERFGHPYGLVQNAPSSPVD